MFLFIFISALIIILYHGYMDQVKADAMSSFSDIEYQIKGTKKYRFCC